MSFNTALSGLKAASNDLKITGNNISNASTVGFKGSRAEFADVYSASILGSGSKLIGNGVQLATVGQQFEQGTISFTSNSLDIAIDGEGFFILEDQGAATYSRAGLFGLDSDGFVVSNSGARLQGFDANEEGRVNGILGDIFIETGNLAPLPTTSVTSDLNLNAEDPVLAEFGSRISTAGTRVVGVAQAGVPLDTPSVLATDAAPEAFDFSLNSNSVITAFAPITPKDFSVNLPSSVTGSQTVVGHDFSINSPSTLASISAPVNFNFSNKPTALTGTAPVPDLDFTQLAGAATFDLTIAGGSGGSGAGTANIALTSLTPRTNINELITDINNQLTGVDIVAVENPGGSGVLEFQASVAGEASSITMDNFAVAGAADTGGLIKAALGGLANDASPTTGDAVTSAGSTFDITIAGGTNDGTATINLNANISSFQGLLSDIQDQLSTQGLSVDVRNDPSNSGRLQFFSTDDGVNSTITVDNYNAGSASTTQANLTALLGVTDGATNVASGAGAIGTRGSLTAASFDLTFENEPAVGGAPRTVTVTLDQNIATNDIDTLVSVINAQLNTVASPGIGIRAQEDPTNAGLLQFFATASGVESVVTVDNFQVSNVAGTDQSTTADIVSVLGGITDGASANNGVNSSASFQVRLSGGANGAGNTTQTITLDDNIQTLQDLITDIRDDIATTGIGLDVREDPTQPGSGILQFFATTPGEASLIEIDPNVIFDQSLGNGVTQQELEFALGRISMGATNADPDPTGFSGVTGNLGELSAATFDITLSNATADNGGPVTITLDSNINNVADLVDDIRDELSLANNIGVDVREDPDNPGRLQFYSLVAGEESVITVNNLNSSNPNVSAAQLEGVLNIATGVTVLGIGAVDNGYPAQTIDVVNSNEDPILTTTLVTLAGESAASIAAKFNAVSGVAASATTTATLTAADYVNNSGTLQVIVNDVTFSSTSLALLADDINNADMGGFSAEIDANTGNLSITTGAGNDIRIAIDSNDLNDSISVNGPNGQAVTLDLAGGDIAAAIGGTVQFTLNENVTLANDLLAGTGLFGLLQEDNFEEFELNSFDPRNQDTYNSATSVTIFDSLGNSHVMTEFFVREPFRPEIIGSVPNRWTVYVQIDGQDVGDPDVDLAPPANTLPTEAGFRLQFNESGEFVAAESSTIHITNWSPVDENGDTTGALGPINTLDNAILPVPDPAISSNFVINLDDSTQFGSVFSVSSVDQNGFATGRLSGLDISDTGLIFARYTNGENQTLGQVTLANFANNQGLKNLGGTSWAETFESGEPVVGTPRSASLGAINSGALEDSNVELSDELVQLIIAQRNFQASAKTIQTIDAVTQTIINLR
ncbi:MAG: flagellar hook-basal body complex protein [Pseudomonadales bacterium]|nr:flagellar hook-basal body complex protein [Pseudomonadales bacterium]